MTARLSERAGKLCRAPLSLQLVYSPNISTLHRFAIVTGFLVDVGIDVDLFQDRDSPPKATRGGVI